MQTVFTLGLTLSSAVDMIITFGMCFYLQESRRGFGTWVSFTDFAPYTTPTRLQPRMDEVLDSIIIYTINNGTLTWLVPSVVSNCRRSCLFPYAVFRPSYH